jgi:hypothetical protein
MVKDSARLDPRKSYCGDILIALQVIVVGAGPSGFDS